MTDDGTLGDDRVWMRAALALARRGLGRVWPNPAVGCIVVRDGRAVGRGWTQAGGRPHAETEALGRAGADARGATAYVTLEPCTHHGLTPPCDAALIEAGIARVVVALADPDPRVAGRGLERLRRAGIGVDLGIEAEAAAAVNAGFLCRVNEGRPLFTLKTATSLDGRIGTASGDSRWITGDAARAAAHRLRATHDAVLIGSQTALADDPDLTCRLPGLEAASPVRIVLDRRLRLPLEGRLVASAGRVPLWVVTGPDRDPARLRELAARGAEVLIVESGPDPEPEPVRLAAALGGRGLTRVLIEGGGRIAAAFLAAGLVDRIAWFRGPVVLGGDGIPSVAATEVARVADAPRFARDEIRRFGDDLLETFVRVR